MTATHELSLPHPERRGHSQRQKSSMGLLLPRGTWSAGEPASASGCLERWWWAWEAQL